MCNKVFLENAETLIFIPIRHKNQKICNEAVDNNNNHLPLIDTRLKYV